MPEPCQATSIMRVNGRGTFTCLWFNTIRMISTMYYVEMQCVEMRSLHM